MIRAGELRHYCDVEYKPVTSTGARGQPVGDWTPLFSEVPTRIESLSGKHLETARQLVASATHRIVLRWHPGIAPSMRLRGLVGQWLDRYFAIGHVGDGSGVGEDMILTCTEQKTGATP